MWGCCMIMSWRCLLHACRIACCLRSLSCPLIDTPFLSAVFYIGMDHGDLLRECRLCCKPSRRRSVFFWLDYNVLKVSNGIHSRRLHHQYRTGNRRRHPHHHRHLRPCRPHRSDRIIPRYQSLLWPPWTTGWTSRERRRRRRSRHRDSHRRRSRSRSHRRRPLGRPANAVTTSHYRTFTPKHPPAVKAMPACRPSGLSYDR